MSPLRVHAARDKDEAFHFSTAINRQLVGISCRHRCAMFDGPRHPSYVCKFFKTGAGVLMKFTIAIDDDADTARAVQQGLEAFNREIAGIEIVAVPLILAVRDENGKLYGGIV